MGLIKSDVVFNEVEHTYTLNGQSMSGVTAILNKYLFGSKYAGISDATLKKAAAKGSLVHSQLQMYINGMPFKQEEPETIACKALLKDKCITPIESEYLISDFKGIASSIDMVDEQYNIYDFKTTSELDIEYLRWQLSIYAYLFEKQNEIKVQNLYAIHLRGDKAKLVEVKRFPDSYIESLIECYYGGYEYFDNPRNYAGEKESTLLTEYVNNDFDIKNYENNVEAVKVYLALKQRQEVLEEQIKDCIRDEGDIDWEREFYSVHYTPSTTYTTSKFNADAFKKDHAKMYAKYVKESETTRKGSVTIKIKENESMDSKG